MAGPSGTHWELEPHTRVKHEILKRYLHAWLPILSSSNGRVVFIDGFAGPGRYSGGEPGSPLIALRSLLDHKHFQKPRAGREVVFIFIEKEAERVEALRGEIEDIALPGWVKVTVLQGEFVHHMSSILDAVEGGGRRLAPTFAFIDPFGPSGLPLDLVARIVGHPRCECLISFMYESITRFLGHDKMEAHLDELFGTDEWRRFLEQEDAESRRDGLVDLYRRQLQERAGLRYVRTFEMINEGNRTEYFLFFGTNSPKGLSKMKEAMWTADPLSGQLFSDRTAGQAVLLEAGGDRGLRQELQRAFRDKGFVEIEEISRFVLEDSAYSEAKHLKRRTLSPMEREGLIEVEGPPGKKRRAGWYTEGTKVRFK